MKKILLLVSALILLVSDAYGQGKTDVNKDPEDRDILQVIEANLEAAEKEDFDAWVKTYHEKARSCKDRGAEMLECFRVYDMTYDLKQAEVLEKSDDEAKVLFLQVNRTVSGPDSNDKEIRGIHIMRKSYGKWKIYDTEIKRIQELR